MYVMHQDNLIKPNYKSHTKKVKLQNTNTIMLIFWQQNNTDLHCEWTKFSADI